MTTNPSPGDPSFMLVWQCAICGSMTTGGITAQKKNRGIAGHCRFCGKSVPARLSKFRRLREEK